MAERITTPFDAGSTADEVLGLVAASPRLEGVGGRYFEDGNEALSETMTSRR